MLTCRKCGHTFPMQYAAEAAETSERWLTITDVLERFHQRGCQALGFGTFCKRGWPK